MSGTEPGKETDTETEMTANPTMNPDSAAEPTAGRAHTRARDHAENQAENQSERQSESQAEHRNQARAAADGAPIRRRSLLRAAGMGGAAVAVAGAATGYLATRDSSAAAGPACTPDRPSTARTRPRSCAPPRPARPPSCSPWT